MTAAILQLEDISQDCSLQAVGGKTKGLAALIKCGARVPKGFVIPSASLLSLESPESLGAISETLRSLRAPWIARSSSSLEDNFSTSAPGLFDSYPHLDQSTWLKACKDIADSANSPAAKLYAKKMSQAPTMAVLIQEYKSPDVHGTFYVNLKSEASLAEAFIEWTDTKRNVKQFTRLAVDSDPFEDPTILGHVQHILEVAKSLGRRWPTCSCLDIEWLIDSEGLHFVQARPLSSASFQSIKDTTIREYPELSAQYTWTRDVHHNPSPLSEAQNSLVKLANDVSKTPLKTVDGYLYEATTSPPLDDLPLKTDFSISQSSSLIKQELGAMTKANSLQDKLQHYKEFLRVYFNDWKHALKKEHPPKHAAHPFYSILNQCKHGFLTISDVVEKIGFASQGWDVSLPTFKEDPHILARALDSMPTGPAIETPEANNYWELDDLWFYEAQNQIRQSLLLSGNMFFPGEPNLIFHLSIKNVTSLQNNKMTAAEGKKLAFENLALRQTRAAMKMPVTVHRGVGYSKKFRSDKILSGIGIGPQTEGVVLKSNYLPTTIPPNTIWLTQTATPASLVMAGALTGIVSETGGQLSHVAAMARELKLSAVVGCNGAWDKLETGDHVTLLCDSGIVLQNESPQSED